MTEISCFVSSIAMIDTAIESGADHLILDDGKLSTRSRLEDDQDWSFPHLKKLATHAYNLSKDIRLSITIDFMIHNKDIPKILALVNELDDLNVSTLRCQDPGLLLIIQKTHPHIQCHLSMETSNNNSISLQSYADLGFSRQCLSNELSQDSIKEMKKTGISMEVQVQGPILLQYSHRRFMQGYQEKEDSHNTAPLSTETIDVTAYDQELPNRAFQFLDNTHGHFMFGQFHRCLLTGITELKELELDSWLIDTRGSSLDYLETSINAYKKALSKELSKEETEAIKSELKNVSGKSQKPGFFIINKTDCDWRDDENKLLEDGLYLGKIIDSKKKERCILECKQDFSVTDAIYYLSPEKKKLKSNIKTLLDLNHQEKQSLNAGDLVQVPWQKGLCIGTKLLKNP